MREAKVDEGLQETDTWGRWFLTAHTQRIAELNLPPDQHDRELASCLAIGEAAVARMKSDYLLRRAQTR